MVKVRVSATRAQKKLFPSLQLLHLENPIWEDESWEPLLPYLAHQTSDGQRVSLTISISYRGEHICKDVLKEMEGLVEGLVLDFRFVHDCPFDRCTLSGEEE